MGLVTLLTDFGIADSYVAEVKGVMLGLAPHITLVDVAHLVAPGDVRRPPVRGPFALAVAVGVLPHLAGPEDAVQMFTSVAERMEPAGQLVLDDIGPSGLQIGRASCRERV